MKSMTKSISSSETIRGRVTFDASFQLISIPSIESLAKDTEGKDVNLLSFDDELTSEYEALRAKINPSLLNVANSDETDIPTDYPVNPSLF